MAGSSSPLVLVFLFLAINGASLLVLAISCQDAVAQMLPCQAFLWGVGEISAPCCRRAQSLSEIANTNPKERRSVCMCLKQAAIVMEIDVGRAKQIPQLCHIDLPPVLIDPHVDCDRLNDPTQRSSRPEMLEPAASNQINQLERLEPVASQLNKFKKNLVPTNRPASPVSDQIKRLQKLETHDSVAKRSSLERLEPASSQQMNQLKGMETYALVPRSSQLEILEPAASQPNKFKPATPVSHEIKGLQGMETHASVAKSARPERLEPAASQP